MIAIKSIKNIPRSCIECELLKHGGYCYYKNSPYELNSHDILDERPKDCPLVEIVTCKDCKYCYENSCDFDGWGVNDDYFCAKGERKCD